MQKPVNMYTLSTCSHCKATKKFLNDCAVKYDFTDVDLLQGEERAAVLEDVKKWVYICARCNSCKFIYRDYQDCCPAGDYFWFEPYWASGKNLIARALLDGDYEMSESVAEKIYSCIMCGNCEQQCEQEISDHLVEIFEALRAEAIDKGYGPMKEHVAFKDNIAKVHNPYAESHEDRFIDDAMKNLWSGVKLPVFKGSLT